MAEKTFDKRQNTQSRLLFGTAKIVMYLFLIALVLLSIVPFYLVMVNATHSSFDIVTRLNLLPGASTLENYATMQSHVNIWRGFLNSLCIHHAGDDRYDQGTVSLQLRCHVPCHRDFHRAHYHRLYLLLEIHHQRPHCGLG